MERLTRILAALTRWGLGLCALVLVLMALYVSLGRELTPLVAEYRADIEDKASAALGMPLQIGELEGNWSGFAPILLAHDVMVGDGANALRLDRVRVGAGYVGQHVGPRSTPRAYRTQRFEDQPQGS